jgi:hypothetical protein
MEGLEDGVARLLQDTEWVVYAKTAVRRGLNMY